MTSDEFKSRRRVVFWGGALLLLGIIAACFYQLFKPSPKIIVSKETTVVTAPLAADGLPDYQAYWRDLGREGVTPENNGAVLFWQATWPGELESSDRRLMIEALGLEKEPNGGASLKRPYATEVRDAIILWKTGVKPDHPDYSPANQMAEEVISAAMDRPWTSGDVPPLADWIARNEKALNLLIEASKRPKWWSPSPSLLGDKYPGGIAIMLPAIQSSRDVARWFSLRAMWHAGEGRPKEAWADLKASMRFARITGEGPTLVGQLVAIAIDGITLDSIVTLLQHGEIDADLARQILADLSAMDKPCDMVKSFDVGERVCYADTAVMMARDSSQIAGLSMNPSPLGIGNLAGKTLDWNFILRQGNRWYDRLVEAGGMPSRKERLEALADINNDLSKLTTNSPVRLASSFVSFQARTALISDTMISLFLPALEGAIWAEDRAMAKLDLVRVAAALAVHRAEKGEYPESLEQLTPAVLARVPEDLYTGKPFIYRRMPDDGYLLYSVYENAQDDGGSDISGEIMQGEWIVEKVDMDYDNSDLVIRVPIPKFELPEFVLPVNEEMH